MIRLEQREHLIHMMVVRYCQRRELWLADRSESGAERTYRTDKKTEKPRSENLFIPMKVWSGKQMISDIRI